MTPTRLDYTDTKRICGKNSGRSEVSHCPGHDTTTNQKIQAVGPRLVDSGYS